MHKELDDVHLLASKLVPDGGTGGIAVRPRAAVDQVHGATFGWSLVVAIVVEAAVPAVQCPWQGCPFDLHISPVAGRQHKGVLSLYKLGCTLTPDFLQCTTSMTHFLVMTSCERHAGANIALKN